MKNDRLILEIDEEIRAWAEVNAKRLNISCKDFLLMRLREAMRGQQGADAARMGNVLDLLEMSGD